MKHTAWTAVCLLLIVACGSPRPSSEPSPSDGPPVQGGTVVIGLLADIQSWNPYLAEDSETEHVLALVYPSLAVEQPDYRLHPPSFEPALAESWTWSDDHLELTLDLDPDARWSDGVAVTAADVVFTWQAQTSPDVGWIYSSAKDSIETVEAVNDSTVRVTYTRRYPYQLMDLNDGLIIPAHAWRDIPFDEWAETDWLPRVLAGGPFDVEHHTPQQEIVLDRNPGYFRSGLPYLDRVVFRVVPSAQGLITQLLAGGLDFVRSIPPPDIGRVRNHQGLELVMYDDRAYTHICWNTVDPRLADPRVRTALTMAVDRDTLVDAVYDGYARVAVGPVLSSFWAFDSELAPLPFDPAAASRLLAEAGWTDTDGDGIVDRDGAPFTIELLASAENEVRQDIAILVQEDLGRVGVRVEPRFVEWGTLLAIMRDGAFDGLVNFWEEPTQVDLGEIWHSPPPGELTLNFGRWANPEVDRLLDEVSLITDFAGQKPLLDRIQELIVADQPYTFLVENIRATGVNTRVRGAEINAATPYFNLDEWYVESQAVK